MINFTTKTSIYNCYFEADDTEINDLKISHYKHFFKFYILKKKMTN